MLWSSYGKYLVDLIVILKGDLLMYWRLAMVFLLVVGLVGCQTTQGEGTKQRVGTILGGVAGAVTGSQFGKGSGRVAAGAAGALLGAFCLLYTSPSPRDRTRSRMPSSA